MKPALNAVALAALLIVCAASAVAAQPETQPPAQRGGGQRQGRGPGKGAGADNAGVTPGEVQRMFDAYALMQAQEQFKISDEQFAKFMTRFKALQEVRRQDAAGPHADHHRACASWPRRHRPTRRRSRTSFGRFRMLDVADRRRAQEGVRSDRPGARRAQQAQFRVFEEVMERRKLELDRARAGQPAAAEIGAIAGQAAGARGTHLEVYVA